MLRQVIIHRSTLQTLDRQQPSFIRDERGAVPPGEECGASGLWGVPIQPGNPRSKRVLLVAAWRGGAAVSQGELCWAPQAPGAATGLLLSWIPPLEFGSRLLQGAQRPRKSLFDLTHDKLFLLAAT